MRRCSHTTGEIDCDLKGVFSSYEAAPSLLSSRRRHTRCPCDWSSDVCSSDRSEEHTSELQSHDNLVCRIIDRKSTRLNSSHTIISYAVFCLKKKNSRVLRFQFSPRDAKVWTYRIGDAGQSGKFTAVAVFFNDTATTEIYTLSLHDALPI